MSETANRGVAWVGALVIFLHVSWTLAAPLSGPLIFQDDFSAGDAGDADEPDTTRWTQTDGADGGAGDVINVVPGNLVNTFTPSGNHYVDTKPTATPYIGYSLPYGTASAGWQFETRFRTSTFGDGANFIGGIFNDGAGEANNDWADFRAHLGNTGNPATFNLFLWGDNISPGGVTAPNLDRNAFYTLIAHHRPAGGPGALDDKIDAYVFDAAGGAVATVIGIPIVFAEGQADAVRVGNTGINVDFDYVQVRVPEPMGMGMILSGALLQTLRRRT